MHLILQLVDPMGIGGVAALCLSVYFSAFMVFCAVRLLRSSYELRPAMALMVWMAPVVVMTLTPFAWASNKLVAAILGAIIIVFGAAYLYMLRELRAITLLFIESPLEPFVAANFFMSEYAGTVFIQRGVDGDHWLPFLSLALLVAGVVYATFAFGLVWRLWRLLLWGHWNLLLTPTDGLFGDEYHRARLQHRRTQKPRYPWWEYARHLNGVGLFPLVPEAPPRARDNE